MTLQTNIVPMPLTPSVLDTGKRVLWQTLKTKMKCRIGGISSWSALFAEVSKKQPSETEKHNFIEILTDNPLQNGQFHTYCSTV